MILKPKPDLEKVSKTDVIAEAAVSGTSMLRGMMLSVIISGYILGPLLILGGGAYWLYRAHVIGKTLTIAAFVLSFIISNALIIARSKKLIVNFSKKTGLKDPTPEEVKKWRASRPESYRYDDEEEDQK